MAVTSVASATASTTLLAANAERRSVTIENSDANRLYVLCDSGTASATNYSFSLAQNENAEVPEGLVTANIKDIWAGDGSGAAHITYL